MDVFERACKGREYDGLGEVVVMLGEGFYGWCEVRESSVGGLVPGRGVMARGRGVEEALMQVG